ncbi:hypothetical protein KC332_g16491 [Hortaea werneckii]|uniref:Secreted protein n=2 Tax=Hortaea werneckii TaxID=91943 RepID=A0A3M7I157_HORWE|nr:hypothetical protein KC358_g16664 [Hortaea werneckii]OTA34058.1 hypothetical protein BTJ68_05900 [Hortaea werneckii EXF-2000]KAI6798189.1 hypothetical protein KC350_g16420 [Hortaea werneckii]KAI6900882.1 hypothetical protein KC348_g16665 [Hortaea werneckii]KAI6920503.1 hypothetical protein KC341_g16570 [Hortaea werneckii]
MRLINTFLALSLSVAAAGAAVAGGPESVKLHPQSTADGGRGTFANPSKHVRPKFRYWIPDASVDPDVVAKDVKTAKEAGMGGLELLGYYLYGGPPNNGAGRGNAAPVDWAEYGFGTEAWNRVFKAFLQAIKDNDMVMDFAIGPNQGTGVPAPESTDGLAWDVAAYNVSVPLGGSFNDVLPGWGAGELLAAVTGLALDSADVVRPDQLARDPGSLPGDYSLNRTQITLSASSLTDVTNLTSVGGHLSVDFAGTNTTDGINHTIFAVYQFRSDYRAQDGPLDLGGPQSEPETWRQNGSWAVDHFSSLGAKTTTDFWEKYLLSNDTLDMLHDVGNYAWEDSVEIAANLYWTLDFLDYFHADHGYSLAKWLPLLFHRNGKYMNSNPDVWWVSDEPDQGNGHIADYRATLANRYQSYLTGLNAWAEEYLKLPFSAQISYNLPMDMLENIPYVDAPECESLDFSDLIDGYRQYAGPANLAGRPIVSSECGAVRGEGFVQTVPELLWHAKRSWAGGINQFVFHGFPYSGDYGNTTWPVFTTFNYQYSDMHGAHRPDWFQYRGAMDYVARNNWVMQAGVPRMDVAFWQKVTTQPGHVELRTYEPTDLEKMGYTYEYLSPDSFHLPGAEVIDGVLAPEAQGFKAMVVRANDSLTIDGVKKLVEWAHDGLPIVLAGGIPETYVGTYNPIDLRETRRSLREAAISLPNVNVTDDYLVASTLSCIGILPRTQIRSMSPTNATWFTNWRSSEECDYVYIYNDAIELSQGQGTAEATIQFNSKGVPYEYDAWTGQQTAFGGDVSTDDDGTTLSLSLAGNQTTIIAFHHSKRSEPTDHSSWHGGHISHAEQTPHPFPTSSAVHAVDPAQSLTLTNWTLVVEHWDPPADLYNITGGASKHNTTHHLPHLVSWQEIPGLQNVSGRGYYSTSFIWPPASPPTSSPHSVPPEKVPLDFGFIPNTLTATLNSIPLPPLDPTRPRILDISPWIVRDGQSPNRLEAVIGTPLGNALLPIFDLLETSSEGPASEDATTVPPPKGRYGLDSPVRVGGY